MSVESPRCPITIRDVTENPQNLIMIQDLMSIQKRCMRDVYEIKFLQDSDISPSHQKHIFEHMNATFSFNKILIRVRPTSEEIYCFIYRKDERLFKFKCSNNMSFRDDIIIICYLNQILCRRHSYQKCEIMDTLITLMKNKYKINLVTGKINNLLSIYMNPEDLTTLKISICFPSISLPVFHYTASPNLSALLPSFRLPRIIFSPMIMLVLPRFLQNPPIAILIAIFVKSDYLLKSQSAQTPLSTIYEYVFECYNSDFLSESLKLNLCIKWRIVEKQNKKYRFISRLIVYRQRAKNLISELRPNDPNLEEILSKI